MCVVGMVGRDVDSLGHRAGHGMDPGLVVD